MEIMSTPNKWGWYKEFHKMMAIKIHTKCFDGTKTYKVGWGKCTGWYLNDTITAFVTMFWKAPIWILYCSVMCYWFVLKYFLLVCGLAVIQNQTGSND